ncbi:type VI secretion system-associated protein TagF [Delftia sp. PS-11]|uniref:type VI secretion system-associated protein TagF n=1 Tax=Delftia sp. PS-11 TaxID=2767222 RepID=UPI00246277D6|nr:type VI secretion system-associated protein TagF [Delftia sp. PS-11]
MPGPAVNTMTTSTPCAAWWGKLPSQGDFVGRRLPHALTMRWDEWLRNGMDQLRSDAGDNWSTRFVQSPIWFFLCPGAILGQPMVGVIGPSSDRVGRLFPLAIMATMDSADALPSCDQDLERFLAGARDALIDARRLPLSAQQLDERLAALHWPLRQARHAAQHQELSMRSVLADLDIPVRHAAHLPRLDWRACMRAGSTTSVWWISPTPQHAHDEVLQRDVLHRRLFTRLFKGA